MPLRSAGSQTESDADDDDLLGSEEKEQIELARQAMYHLLKGVKSIAMYRHAENKFPQYLERAHQAIAQYHEKFKTLQVKVDLTNFQLYGKDLFTDDTPIPYKFFKDGIRQMMFNPGLTVDELVKFTLIALSDVDRGADDLNVQLWRAQLPHFEYIMVEGFRMDEFSEAEVQVEVDKVVDYLQKRLRTNSDDYLRFARVTEDDLDMRLNEIEQMRGVVVGGVTADATLKARIQKEVDEEENQRLFPKLVSAVFQVVESGVDDTKLLAEMFTQLLDAMLLQEDFATLNQVVLKLRAMEQRAGPTSGISSLLRGFLQKMSDSQRVSRLGDMLRFSRLKHPNDVARYLANLSQDTVPTLLDICESMEIAENKAVLLDALVHFAKVESVQFVMRLESDRPQMVRDMIYVLDRANHADKLHFFAKVLHSPNLANRLEVISIIARGRTGEAQRMIAGLLNDSVSQVRIQAARVLPEFDRDRAYLDLMNVVKTPQFEKREASEREAVYTALGSTGVPAATNFFAGILQQKPGLLNKKKITDEKLLAIAGIGGAATILSAKMLQEIADGKDQPPEVVMAARKMLVQVRKTVFGEKGA